ncbi:UNKNOWN [Stylonychia lemnae]|uniref:Uncharacterized protein n=1 Tax=Stylonychia lemnae TaxID=5949 RepID=A0A078A8Z8_STYLE|nr:UNKNOWN [Stylonychia lemnae]|eukprot:CDW78694.1 UNKNOWN [Stylonychia lemnae]
MSKEQQSAPTNDGSIDHEEMFHTNSYPASVSENKMLTLVIRLLSIGIIVIESYTVYALVKQIYEFVTQVHREPDVVMLITLAYFFSSAYKIAVCTYGYNFATYHTERTPENYQGFFKNLNTSSSIKFFVSAGIGFFLYYHQIRYTHRFGKMETDLVHYIHVVQKILALQVAVSWLYNYLFKRLYSIEITQPRVVDTKAASIKITH